MVKKGYINLSLYGIIICLISWSYILFRIRLRDAVGISVDSGKLSRAALIGASGAAIVILGIFFLIAILPERNYNIVIVWLIFSSILWMIVWVLVCMRLFKNR